MPRNHLASVAVLVLAVNLVLCDVHEDDDVIDLQDLLRNVSSTLKSCQAELSEQASRKCSDQQPIPLDCADLNNGGQKRSGVYTIQPLGFDKPFDVFCDMFNDKGGWTVIQRRGDYGNRVDYFDRTWDEYKTGFGDIRKEFWLGNDKIWALTRQNMENDLLIFLIDMDKKYLRVSSVGFWLDNEENGYELHAGRNYENKGLLEINDRQKFSTRDRGPLSSYAETYKGGWWHKEGQKANLNGLNLKGTTQRKGEGIFWDTFKGANYSLFSEMRVKGR